MSKTDTRSNFSEQAAIAARHCSIIELKKQFASGIFEQEAGYDLRTYCDDDGAVFYPWMFSKTLPHDNVHGFPLASDVDVLIKGIRTGVLNIDDIRTGVGNKKQLENPLAQHSFNLMGTDSTIPKLGLVGYKNDTPQAMSEMLEVYARAFLRDVAFQHIVDPDLIVNDEPKKLATKANIKLVLDALNSFDSSERTSHPVDDTGKITARTLFRGSSPGELDGPYISQFLIEDFNYGNIPIKQRYLVEQDHWDGTDNILDKDSFVAMQNGAFESSGPTESGTEYVWNQRVMASKVHSDPLYQFYYNAALIAMQKGIQPETKFPTSAGSVWTSGGFPSVLAAVAHVALGSLRTAWNAKYAIGMKIRPEVMAQRIVLSRVLPQNLPTEFPGLNASKVPGLAALTKMSDKDDHPARDDFLIAYAESNSASLYLNVLYSEGSPTHPSWVAGHAAVAGACVTVLKAMLKCHSSSMVGTRQVYTKDIYPSTYYREARDQGDDIDYTEASRDLSLTIIGELNKLCSNVALGRDSAGVHFRCDGECGKLLGEDYAISYLVDVAREYHEGHSGMFDGFLLEKFDGKLCRITSDGVQAV